MDRECIDSATFIQSLWKQNSLFSAKVPIVDTLVQDSNRPASIMWLFSDSKGNVRKKKDSNCTAAKIVERFLGQKLDGDDLSSLDMHTSTVDNSYGAYFTSEGEFKLIDRSEFLKTISKSLSKTEVVSQIKSSNPESYYILYVSNKESSTIYKCYRQSASKERSLISASTIITTLKQISSQIIQAVEKNIHARIEESEMIFVEDEVKNLYFMGSYFCRLRTLVKLTHLASDRKQLEFSRLRSISTSKTNKRLMSRTASSIAKFRVNSIQEVDSINLFFKRTIRNDCAGDFCRYVISSGVDHSRDEIDYDNLLDMVRDSGHDREGILKLHQANDFILKKRDQLRYSIVQNEIPFNLIALGKIFIQRCEVDLEDDPETIDLGKILYSFVGDEEGTLKTDRKKLRNSAMKIPFHYYNNVKVCDGCYLIYNILKKSQHESKKQTQSQNQLDSVFRSQSITVTRESGNESPIRVWNKRPGGRGSIQLGSAARKYAQTALGIINKNSIDDLLVDMNHAIVNTQLTDESGNRKKFLKLCQSQTEGFKLNKLEQETKHKYEITPKLNLKLIESPIKSELKQDKLLPIAIPKLSSRCRSKGSWKRFIEMTRVRRS